MFYTPRHNFHAITQEDFCPTNHVNLFSQLSHFQEKLISGTTFEKYYNEIDRLGCKKKSRVEEKFQKSLS